MKKYTLVIAILAVIVAVGTFAAHANAASDLTGWAWSSNTGWLSFNSSNTGDAISYHVSISTTTSQPTIGTFGGYGWSPNIGWVSFNSADVAGCPTSDPYSANNINGCVPSVNLSTGQITGWARACVGTANADCVSATRTDGWDGWIQLSGTNHISPDTSGNAGVTFDAAAGTFKGFAWDGNAVPTGSLGYTVTSIIVDAQNSLNEQYVDVTNNTAGTLAGIRVTLTSTLPAGVTAYSYSGTDSTGHVYYQHNYAIPAGQTVRVHIQYANSGGAFSQPTFSITAITTPISEPTISGGTQISSTKSFTSGGTTGTNSLVSWTAANNKSYGVQYSDDGGSTWRTAFGKTNSNAVIYSNTSGSSQSAQWLDFGPFQTRTVPASARQYKVLEFANGANASDRSAAAGSYTPAASGYSWNGVIGWLSFNAAAGTQVTCPTCTGVGSPSLTLQVIDSSGVPNTATIVTANSNGSIPPIHVLWTAGNMTGITASTSPNLTTHVIDWPEGSATVSSSGTPFNQSGSENIASFVNSGGPSSPPVVKSLRLGYMYNFRAYFTEVTVTINPYTPPVTPTCTAPQHSTLCPGSDTSGSTVHLYSLNSCPATVISCQFQCDSGYTSNGVSCTRSNEHEF